MYKPQKKKTKTKPEKLKVLNVKYEECEKITHRKGQDSYKPDKGSLARTDKELL